MTMTSQQVAELQHLWRNPLELAKLLRILRVPTDGQGTITSGTLTPMHPEQQLLAETIQKHRQTFVVKARRMGITTFVQAYLFARAYTSPQPGRRIMSMAHHESAVRLMLSMVRGFEAGLPDMLRGPLRPNNQIETGFYNGSLMVRDVAGGGGQGRSWGYSDIHATEMAFWPHGGTAHRGNASSNSDREVWQSLMATQDDPEGKVIVESTGNGPRGLFYDLYQRARTSPEWGFLFFPWNEFPRYSHAFADERELRDFEQDLTTAEATLRSDYNLSLEQLKWRRFKFEVEDYDLQRFRMEFPLTDAEPFLLDRSGWFDGDMLNNLLLLTDGNDKEKLQTYLGIEPGRDYFFGVDTCGGVGEDYACIQILRDDMEHVGTWRCNITSPYGQADMISKLGALFNKPSCLIEANKHGLTVIKRVRQLGGVRLFHSDTSTDGNFWATGGRAGASKREAYDYARQVIDNGWAMIQHPETIREGLSVIEKPSGRIEAASGHDDAIDAYVYALWCGRTRFVRRGTVDEAKARHRRRMARLQDPWGFKSRMAA